MKKLFAMLLAAMLVLAVAAPVMAEDDSVAKIQEKGTFILGLDDSFEPMGFRDENNEIVGFDIDLAKEVAARLGVELVLQPISWDAKELELSSGNIDCIWNGMSDTPARQESMSLSLDYLNNAMVFLVKDPAFKGREDLVGKKVGVQSGSYAQELLEGADFADYYKSLGEVLGYADYPTAIMDLTNGNIDAVLIDQVVANYKLKDLNDASLFTIDNLGDDFYAIGFRKEDVALRDKVNEVLKEMAKDGKVAEISTKWFGSDISMITAD